MNSRSALIRSWLLSLLVLGCARGVAAQGAEWDEAISAFRKGIAADVMRDHVGGIAVGVVVDGDLVWARAFGQADRDRPVPMGTATISRVGSISKCVTAVLLMRLVDRGVVSLEDPVTRWLPEFAEVRDARPGAAAVTLRQLASHTAGLSREPALDSAASGPIAGWEAKILESIPHTRIDTLPGARFQYSNIGFGILGLALSRAAHRPFVDLVEEEVFGPLGMTSSTFVVGPELAPRLAVGYENLPDGSIDADRPAREHAGRGYKVPNGGVYTTLADLGRLIGALSGEPGLRILSEASRREMLTVQTPGSPDDGYGLGLFLRKDGKGRLLASHNGSVSGYTAAIAFDPDARVGVVVLRNYQSGTTDPQAASRLVARLRALRTDAPVGVLLQLRPRSSPVF